MTVLDDALRILGDLVGFPTVTGDPNADLIDYAEAHLAPLGYEVRRSGDGVGVNLLAGVGPGTRGGIVLSGHTDVVPADPSEWTGSPFVARRHGDRIYGRGTADMKGFIACALAMAPRFAAHDLSAPVHIALTFDEEVGCRGAPFLIDDMVSEGITPRAVIVGEPTEMGVVTAHKGMHEFTTRITGVEGHGSLPGQGVNAVHFGSRFVAALLDVARELRGRASASSPFFPPETTINVGSMHGGAAHNVIAGDCVIQWELRPVSAADATHALDAARAIEASLLEEMLQVSDSAGIETVTDGAVGGLEHDARSPAVDLLADVLGDPQRRVVSFGTEAGLYQSAGFPAAVCGPGSIEAAHQPDEFIPISQMESCLEMMEALVRRQSR